MERKKLGKNMALNTVYLFLNRHALPKHLRAALNVPGF